MMLLLFNPFIFMMGGKMCTDKVWAGTSHVNRQIQVPMNRLWYKKSGVNMSICCMTFRSSTWMFTAGYVAVAQPLHLLAIFTCRSWSLVGQENDARNFPRQRSLTKTNALRFLLTTPIPLSASSRVVYCLGTIHYNAAVTQR